MKPKWKKDITRAIRHMLLALVLSTPRFCHADWQLVWSDEFNQPDGSAPDPTKWGYDIGNGGWGNAELEYYTSRTNNARIAGGQLVIEADQESYGSSSYTSARLLTKGKWSWAYGRVEARIKIPRGQGIWPAFWMLGTNIDSVGWPTCGEIDIMENIGKTSDQGTAHGTIHGPQSGGDYNGGAGVGGTFTLPAGAALADDFHIFAVEWTTNQIQWFVDTNLYFTATPARLPGGATWVFTHPQFLLLNVAVGGYWPRYPDETTVFPQQMLVDYVRVYSYVAAAPSPIAVAIQSGAQVSWPTTAGTTWTLQSANAAGANVIWNTLLGPVAGDGTTNTLFDPLWPTQHTQYQVLQVSSSTANIVVNGGFETGSGSSVSNWSTSGSQPPVRVSISSHGGQFSMSLAVTNPTSTPNGSSIDQNVAGQGGPVVVPGQTYNFSFWAYQVSSGPSLVQNYKVTWLNSSGTAIGDTGWIGFSGGGGFWTQISANNLAAPANAVNASITIYGTTGNVANGYGQVLIDDVSLASGSFGQNQTNEVSPAAEAAMQISWPSTSGNSYNVQWNNNLGSSNWSNLVSAVAGNANTNTVSDVISTNQYRFYRVVQLP
jgi:beta-glucanase (GH16 family)